MNINIAESKSFSVNTTTSPTVTIESWDDFPAHGAFDVTGSIPRERHHGDEWLGS